MIICRTPFRISFFGGGTDFPHWYKKNGGAVISSTIDKYCFSIVRNLPPIFDYKYRLRYFQNEFAKNKNSIKHKSIYAVLKKYHKRDTPLEIVHNADLPALSGLGASSAFTVSLINSIKSLNDKSKLSKKILAESAIEIEQEILNEYVGSQDQYSCAYGGLNYIKFSKNKINVKNIAISKNKINELQQNIILFFTGIQRKAQIIEKDKLNNLDKNYNNLIKINSIVNEAKKIFFSKKNFDLILLSELLNESWILKKSLSRKVTNSKLDEIFEVGIRSGALAGKILGAGGGGFIMFLTPNNKIKEKIKNNLKKLTSINIKFDIEGSKIIHKSYNDNF